MWELTPDPGDPTSAPGTCLRALRESACSIYVEEGARVTSPLSPGHLQNVTPDPGFLSKPGIWDPLPQLAWGWGGGACSVISVSNL